MRSQFRPTGAISLPFVNEEVSMLPFVLATLEGLPDAFKQTAQTMLKGIKCTGIGYFTIHGKALRKGNTLRRPAPHTDGNYEPVSMSFGGGNGWKVGENGAGINTDQHARQYLNPKGGIIMATNYPSCLGWQGDFTDTPKVGGDCTHIKLGAPHLLRADTVYYGNNHFIHESIPVDREVHRVFARITLPEDHVYN